LRLQLWSFFPPIPQGSVDSIHPEASFFITQFCVNATAGLDRVRELIERSAPDIRIMIEGGRIGSLGTLEGLAELENDSDDA
jgi:hypothetical protein